MEKRIGCVAILLTDLHVVSEINTILSNCGSIIIGRLGLPVKDRGVHVISVIVDGTTDEIGAMTGKIGRLKNVQVKSVLTKATNSEE